jgi:hypothetical protein
MEIDFPSALYNSSPHLERVLISRLQRVGELLTHVATWHRVEEAHAVAAAASCGGFFLPLPETLQKLLG